MESSTNAGGKDVGKKLLVGAGIVAGVGIGGYLLYSYAKKQKEPSGGVIEDGKGADIRSVVAKLKEDGNDLFKKESYNKAIECYTKAIEHDSQSEKPGEISHILYQNRAAANEKLNKYDEVVEDCNAALSFQKNYVKAIIRRARAFEKLDKLEDALSDLTAACILGRFQNQSVVQDAESVLSRLGKQKAKIAFQNRTKSVPISKTFVDSFLQSFCEDPILNSLRKLGHNDRGDISTQNGPGFNEINGESEPPVVNGFHGGDDEEEEEVDNTQGYTYAQQCLVSKRYEEVIPACTDEITSLKTKNLPEALLLRATFNLMLGQSEKATEDLNHLFQELDNLDEYSDRYKKLKSNAYIKLSSIQLQQGNKDETMKDLALALEVDSANADVYQNRGQICVLLGDIPGAIADYKAAAGLRPDFAIAHVQLAYAEFRAAIQSGSQLDTEKALRDLEKTVERFPSCSEGWALLGQALAESEDLTGARDMFKKSLSLNPENANVVVHMGLLELQISGDPASAVSKIEEALTVDKNCEFAYETLGTIELQRGNMAKAIGHLKQALSLARTELELAHLYSLYEGAISQQKTAATFGVNVSLPGGGLTGIM